MTSSPAGLEQSKPSCDRHTVPPDSNPDMTNQVVCDSNAFGTPCPPGASYPQTTAVKMPPPPANLATMANPCAGVPSNPWCPARRHHARPRKRRHRRRG